MMNSHPAYRDWAQPQGKICHRPFSHRLHHMELYNTQVEGLVNLQRPSIPVKFQPPCSSGASTSN